MMGYLAPNMKIIVSGFVLGLILYLGSIQAEICDSCYVTKNITSPKHWSDQRSEFITCVRNQMLTRALHDILQNSSEVVHKVYILYEYGYDNILTDNIIGTISVLNITFEVLTVYSNDTRNMLSCCTKKLPEIDSLFISIASSSTTLQALTLARSYHLLGPLYNWILIQTDSNENLLQNSGIFIPGDRVHILNDVTTYNESYWTVNTTTNEICQLYTQLSQVKLYRSLSHNVSLTSSENWTVASGWNLQQQGLSEFKGFYGKVFTAATLPVQYVSIRQEINGTLIYKGVFFDTLDELARILNFRIRYVEAPTKTWRETIFMVITRKVDFAVGPFTVTADRKEVVDFMFPILTDYLSILMKVPNESALSSSTLVYENIQYPVWLAYLGVVLVCGTVLWTMVKYLSDLDNYKRNSKIVSPMNTFKNRFRAAVNKNRKESFKNTVLMKTKSKDLQNNNYMEKVKLDSIKLLVLWRLSIFNVFAAAFAQGYPLPRDALSTRTLMIFIRLFFIVALAAYTANLVAFLSVRKFNLPVNTLEELVNQKEYKVGCLGDSVHQTIFEEATSGIFKKVWEKIQENPKNNLPTDITEGLQKVANPNEKFIYITEMSLADISSTYDCSLGMAKELFFPRSMAFPTQKGSPYTPIFSEVLMKIHEAGLIDKWLDHYRPKNLCDSVRTETTSTSLSLTSLLGAYELAGLGCVISTGALIGELILARYRKQKQQNKVQPIKIKVQPTEICETTEVKKL